jgi:N-acetylglutamate synthase-like GNAT family acetyltransferase
MSDMKFSRGNGNVVPIAPNGFTFTPTTERHLQDVVRLINKEAARSGAVLKVGDGEVSQWSKDGLSMVVLNGGKVIGHQAMYIWPESKWAEFRAAVVEPEFRGHNINFHVKQAFLDMCIEKHPQIEAFVGLKNGESRGWGIFEALGFKRIPTEQVPGELFEIGIGQTWHALYLSPADYKTYKVQLAQTVRD